MGRLCKMIKNELLKKLSAAPTTYNKFFIELSSGEKPEDIDIPEFSADELGAAIDAELTPKQGNDETYDSFNEVMRAAKIGFSLLKVKKTPKQWAMGGIRGGH